MSRPFTTWLVAAALCGAAVVCSPAQGDDADAKLRAVLAAARPTGFCVHLGCGEGRLAAGLSRGGWALVHAIDADADAVEAAQASLRSQGIYGHAWAEHLAGTRLPYAENVVNLLVADGPTGRRIGAREILRVLRPEGVATWGPDAGDASMLKRKLTAAGFVNIEPVSPGSRWLRARKRRPAELGQWSHPRHGPGGNAACADRIVGPPRRVRWQAGPMHESSSIVSAGGRYFHSGLIARDAFNGLRLWSRPITPPPFRVGYTSRAPAGSVLPVAVGDRLYVVTEGKLQALDAATGKAVCTYPAGRDVREILVADDVLLATGARSVQAFDAAAGKRLWSISPSEPAGVIAGDGGVYLLTGTSRRGGKRGIVKLELAAGRVLWQRDEYAWAPGVRRLSYHDGLLVCEVSTFNNDRPGNGIHVLAASDGAVAWQRSYEPGMTHWMQARAIQAGGLVWVLGRGVWEGLDRHTGRAVRKHRAGSGHCYPPVATAKYLLAGEMSFTDQRTGRLDSNPITKGACGRDAGFVTANGLIYTAPKHCACWPMLQGYTALAVARDGQAWGEPAAKDFPLERGSGGIATPKPDGTSSDGADWPCYRGDAWRSGSTAAAVPSQLDVLWTADLGDRPDGKLLEDWKQNLFVAGPVTPPVIAGGRVFVARPDAHQLVALDAATGRPRWRFTANGRVDGPPTIHAGLCLFGTRSGWVYCLRAADGKLVWRRRAARDEDRIVSFGQLESPWPVAGSVLVFEGVAYFAAGRQALADGGVLVFAVDPATGKARWISRIHKLPMRGYYGGAGLEFDPIDLMVAEAPRPTADAPTGPGRRDDFVTMSRWRIDRRTGRPEAMWKSGFGYYRTGQGGVMASRGVWTYGPRMEYHAATPQSVRTARRPLMVFRDNVLIGSSNDGRRLFRREFTDADAAAFNDEWFNQRHVPRRRGQKGDRNRSERLARRAKWTVDAFDAASAGNRIAAMALTAEKVFLLGQGGRLRVFAADSGKLLADRPLPAAVWDGLAAAGGSLYVTAADGKVFRLGSK